MKFNSHSQRGPISVTPRKRLDDQMYKRPEPNPFTDDWCDGYEDGLNGCETNAAVRAHPLDYWDGVKNGKMEREEMERNGSSNT